MFSRKLCNVLTPGKRTDKDDSYGKSAEIIFFLNGKAFVFPVRKEIGHRSLERQSGVSECFSRALASAETITFHSLGIQRSLWRARARSLARILRKREREGHCAPSLDLIVQP